MTFIGLIHSSEIKKKKKTKQGEQWPHSHLIETTYPTVQRTNNINVIVSLITINFAVSLVNLAFALDPTESRIQFETYLSKRVFSHCFRSFILRSIGQPNPIGTLKNINTHLYIDMSTWFLADGCDWQYPILWGQKGAWERVRTPVPPFETGLKFVKLHVNASHLLRCEIFKFYFNKN